MQPRIQKGLQRKKVNWTPIVHNMNVTESETIRKILISLIAIDKICESIIIFLLCFPSPLLSMNKKIIDFYRMTVHRN